MSAQKSNVIVGTGRAVVFTICNLGYLPQAMVAVNSYGSVSSSAKKIVFLVDAVCNATIGDVEIISLGDVKLFAGEQNVDFDDDILKRYTVTSLCTAIKPIALLFTRLRFSGYDYYVYTDPDTYWMQKPNLDLQAGELNFFRHRNSLFDTSGYSGRNFLTFGGMNLGLIMDAGVSLETIKKWNAFALPINLESSMLGYYTDQRPADLMVLSGQATSKYDERINLSYWNIADVQLTREQGTYMVNQFGESKKLVMFHFSGYKKKLENYAAERKEEYLGHPNSTVIQELHNHYTQLVDAERAVVVGQTIPTNNYGKAHGGEIYGQLIKSRLGQYSGFRKTAMTAVIRSHTALRMIDRLYKIKNPLKI
jgi:hypothetical protein